MCRVSWVTCAVRLIVGLQQDGIFDSIQFQSGCCVRRKELNSREARAQTFSIKKLDFCLAQVPETEIRHRP